MSAGSGASATPWSAVAKQGPGILLALVPGVFTVYLGFRDGGFAPGVTAAAALMMLLFLVVRILVVPRPAEGVNRAVALAVGALVLLALWALLSSRWSHSSSRALIEFDRTLLYAATLAVFGAVGMSRRRLRWMVRALALATLVVCGAGLLTRLLPDLWPLSPNEFTSRLSYPLVYWNAFGLLATVGIVLCVGLTSNERESRAVRVLAAAAIPVLACTLPLTLSRGAVASAVVGVLVFVVVGHPRGLLAAVLAAGPATAIAVSLTYGADLLVSSDAVGSAARDEGQHVATVVALCAIGAAVARGLLLYVDDVVAELRPSRAARQGILLCGAVALAVGVLGAAVAVDAPGKYRAFVSSGASNNLSIPEQLALKPRQRLTTITDNGRVALWTVALDEFKRHVVHGTGAGTYQRSWDLYRPNRTTTRDAHSLYAETLGELGIVGLALLLTTLITMLVAIARRCRGRDRSLYATIFAAICAWAVSAGFDWHWEMPAVTLWVFALGGAAIAGTRNRTPATRFLGMLPRWTIAIACCILIVLVPLRVVLSDARQASALDAYLINDCPSVAVFAGQSLDAVNSRPDPRLLLAGCELRNGDARSAVATLREAIRLDPDNWRLNYSLAVVQARSGEDPRPQIRRTRELNPLDRSIQDAARALLRGDRPDQWRATARRMRLEVLIPAP